jgi:hypothetical protein
MDCRKPMPRFTFSETTRRKGATACKHQEDQAISRRKKLASSAAPGSWLFELERCLTVQHCLQAVRPVKWFVFLGLASSGTNTISNAAAAMSGKNPRAVCRSDY